jgi:hypothetical protein
MGTIWKKKKQRRRNKEEERKKRQNERKDLTLTGLLMEGVARRGSQKGCQTRFTAMRYRRATCQELRQSPIAVTVSLSVVS